MFPDAVKSSTSNFTHYPLAWFALSFVLGIFTQNIFGMSKAVSTAIIFASIISSLILRKSKYYFLIILAGFVSIGALALQVEKDSVRPDRLKNLYDSSEITSGSPVQIIGVSQGKPELAVGGFFVSLKAEHLVYKDVDHKVSGTVRIFAPVLNEQSSLEYEQLQIGYGTRISAACELRREDKFINPGVSSTKEILDGQGIDAGCSMKSPLLFENLGETNTFAPLAWAYEQRQNLVIEFKKHFSAATAGVLSASLLGNKYHLDKATSEGFREGGTFHILVISGLQITFIGGLLILILRRFMRSKLKQFILASFFLWTYTLAVGADAPVLRAALMFTVLHFAATIYRQGTLFNSLGASALILLIWHPSDVFNQSFQLTFICVLAIVGMAFPLLERLREIGEWHPQAESPIPPNVSNWLKDFCEVIYWSEDKWREKMALEIWECHIFKTPYAEKLERWKLQKPLQIIFETLVVSIIVQAWLLPITIIYFHRIPIVSILLNIWVGMLMAVESITALLGVFTTQISDILAAPFIWITEIFNWIILNSTFLFIESDWSSIRIPHYSGTGRAIYLLYYVPVIICSVLIYKWKPFDLLKSIKNKTRGLLSVNARLVFNISLLTFSLLTAIIILHPFSAIKPDGKLHVDFLDVGQGDSALITMPTGETLLVDGGGRTDYKLYLNREGEEPETFEPDIQEIGESVVSRFLWEKGYSKIDYLIATHADTDHMQGLTIVAKNFSINSAFVGRTPFDDEDFADFYKVLERKNIPLKIVSQGDVLNFGDVRVEVLHPQKEDSSKGISENNHSVVLRIVYGEAKILMTGDIEKESEKEILENPEYVEAGVVKVAHHGSKTSSTQDFVNATRAKLAVISVGRESPFGHPKPEIVERWKKSGAKVMTTGEKGTITVTTDGKRLQIETFTK